jgi:hypothetical protein
LATAHKAPANIAQTIKCFFCARLAAFASAHKVEESSSEAVSDHEEQSLRAVHVLKVI